jgi:hypothetical protein
MLNNLFMFGFRAQKSIVMAKEVIPKECGMQSSKLAGAQGSIKIMWSS